MEHSSDSADCHLKEKYDSCVGLPAYEHEGAHYCVLHLPREDKRDDFRKAIGAKLRSEDFDFAGAFFPSGMAHFEGHEFVSANFSGAIFCGDTDFSQAQFSGEGTYFGGAQFSSAETSFREAGFRACLVRNKVGPGGAKSASPIGTTEGDRQPLARFRRANSPALEAHLAKIAINRAPAYARACTTV